MHQVPGGAANAGYWARNDLGRRDTRGLGERGGPRIPQSVTLDVKMFDEVRVVDRDCDLATGDQDGIAAPATIPVQISVSTDSQEN